MIFEKKYDKYLDFGKISAIIHQPNVSFAYPFIVYIYQSAYASQ